MGCGIAGAGDKIKDQLAVHHLYFKYRHFIHETNIMFNSADFLWSSYILFLHHVQPILHICIIGARFGRWAYFYARRLDQSGRIRGSSPTSWLHHLAFGLHRRPVGCTIWHSDFVADQLDGLLSAHFISQPTGQTARRLGFIVSYAGGLTTMLGTPQYSAKHSTIFAMV